MNEFMMSLDYVQNSIDNGWSRATCQNIHPLSCNQFCSNYVFSVAANTYKTYATVYLIQLLFKIKAMAKDPLRQVPKFLISYAKSTSLTAVQMMIMRRILCFLAKHYRNGQNNLIWANFFSGFYLLIESFSRQRQIALYQLNGTSLIIYNMAKRRKMIKGIPFGQTLLFACAIMVISYHLYNNRQAFRSNYVQTIFEYLIGNV